MSDETGLEFFTDDQLVGELKRRCEAIVIGAVKRRDDAREEYSLFWQGGLCHCIGISERTTARLIQMSLSSPTIEVDPDIEENG